MYVVGSIFSKVFQKKKNLIFNFDRKNLIFFAFAKFQKLSIGKLMFMKIFEFCKMLKFRELSHSQKFLRLK